MEGSPVRGQERPPIARLNESQNLQTFQAELIRLIGAELQHIEIFLALSEAGSGTLQLPSWVRSYLERHAGLFKKLEQGEMVGISHAEESRAPRPAASARSSVVLIPLIGDAMLHAVIGLVSSVDGPQLSAEDIEGVRRLADEAAPIFVRLQEIQRLRRENKQLAAAAEGAAEAEAGFAKLIEAKNALDAVIQMRSHLQANIVHDLRTPLAAIRGYARMILDGRAGEVTDTQKEYLRIVSENTNRLINVVSWMSYVADLNAHHFTLSTFDLREVWEECVRAAQQSLDRKSLVLIEQIPGESFVIMGDRKKLARVFEELIAAAVEFSQTTGTITAEFSHSRDREATVKIAARNAVLPADALTKIFERSFNTIAKPTAQNMDACASNLSGVYDVVAMHGGRVFVNGSAGQGATFLFTLPAVVVDGEENNHEQTVNSSRRR